MPSLHTRFTNFYEAISQSSNQNVTFILYNALFQSTCKLNQAQGVYLIYLPGTH